MRLRRLSRGACRAVERVPSLAQAQTAGKRRAPKAYDALSRPVRVLHVFNYFHPDFTGEGLYTGKINALLRPRGIRADVLAVGTAARPGTEGAGELAGFDRVAYLGLGPIRRWKLLRTLLPIVLFLARRARDYDLVHFHTMVDRSCGTYLFLKALGIPIVQSCTLSDSPTDIVASYRPAYRKLVGWLLASVDRFVAISPRLYRTGLDLVSEKKMLIIPQGVRIPATTVLDRLPERTGSGPARLELLFVGGISPRKEVGFLIEALATLRQRLAGVCEISLKIVGPDLDHERYGADVRRLAVERGVADAVAFVGYVSEPAPYYLASDVFILASNDEGFGNVVIEAMSYGLPVVCRLLPGVTDFIVDSGVNGFLFEDAEGCVETVARLARDPALRREIGARARADACARFAMEGIAETYRALYEELAR